MLLTKIGCLHHQKALYWAKWGGTVTGTIIGSFIGAISGYVLTDSPTTDRPIGP